MSEWAGPIVLALLAAGLIGLAYWLLFATEGVYLGQPVVTWLYNRYATRYDGIKGFVPEYERMFLAEPLLAELKPVAAPDILDVAAGTGRLAAALADLPAFSGRVIGVDPSRRMLETARHKLGPGSRLVLSQAERLPFADAQFDAVTCLEALEFMTSAPQALSEMARVLRPGGVLLVTNRLTTRWMPGRGYSARRFQALLERSDFEQIEFERWQVDYDKVWARKAAR